eukprot:Lithocolla_globosa_v1_NODE_1062_length_2902_cov_8.613062.p2 type:complete len:429 gc:universal NODE_1062_length_2902_cov_8.613062:2784-1498(-)
MLDFEGIGQFHDLQLTEKENEGNEGRTGEKSEEKTEEEGTIPSLTSFWHVPAVSTRDGLSDDEKEEDSPFTHDNNWKIVGSPPRRSTSFGSTFSFNQIGGQVPRSTSLDSGWSSSLWSNSDLVFDSGSLPSGSPIDFSFHSPHHDWDPHEQNEAQSGMSSQRIQIKRRTSSVDSSWDRKPKEMDTFWDMDQSPALDFSMDQSDDREDKDHPIMAGDSHGDLFGLGLSPSGREEHMTRKKLLTKSNKSSKKEKGYGDNDVPSLATGTFYRVEFKSKRMGVYFLEDERGVAVKAGDLVLVEADRGKDLGRVLSQELIPDKEAKYIIRLAQASEISQLSLKAQDEAKALALCQNKIRQKKLPMEVIEAEYQWDRRKLTYYFVADRRIDFRELVRELFKIYKTRLWMCSVEDRSIKKAHISSSLPTHLSHTK